MHAATALGKLLDLPGFAAVLGTYRLLPSAVLLPAAILVVLAELAIAVGLMLGRRQRVAALAAAGLAALNGLVLTVTLLRGIDLPNCGCFGVFLARPLSVLSPLEDLLLLALALVVAWCARP